MDDKNYILLVFEGERTEKIIVDNLKKYYLNEGSNTIVYGLYCNVIYDVYEALHDEEGELLFDILPILKNMPQNKQALEHISRDNVSEIYLFFDHDGHSHIADEDKLTKMLKHFNNETENGKLYISYPMVEALKHLSPTINFTELTCDIEYNTHYKKIVNDDAEAKYIQIRSYTQEVWEEVVVEHSKRLGYLCHHVFEPLCKIVSQEEVFVYQQKRYIRKNNSVAVLSAFPLFLLDYYGYEYFNMCKSENHRRYVNFKSC